MIDDRRKTINIFKHWLLDCQFQIDSDKNTIRRMLKSDFKEEYRSVLTKMIRFCNTIAEAEAKANIVDKFDEDIFNLDLISYFTNKGLNFTGMNIGKINDDLMKAFDILFPLETKDPFHELKEYENE